jgi:hypothetical protein
MSKELSHFDWEMLSMGKTKEEIYVESDLELFEAGLGPDEIAQMTVRSQELLRRYSHYDLDEGDEEGAYDE